MTTSYLRQWSEERQHRRTQFPQEVVGPVTIWPRYTDVSTGSQINIRAVLQGCFWNDDSIAVFQRTGQQTSNSVTLFIPYANEVTGRSYITPEKWYGLPVNELNQYWTVDPKNLPLMVKGASDFEFTWAAPTASNRIAVQENAFMSANANVRRAKDINEQIFGSPDMWHVEIRA